MPFLAVDVGGTSTRAAVVDDDGTCVSYGAAGSGNPTSSGAAAAASAIIGAAGTAMAQAGSAAADLVASVVGLAGASGGTAEKLCAELASAGLPESLTLESDLLVAFCAGSLATDGYALVAGTGAGAVRIRGAQVEATCDGLGWLLGDVGSGFWIGHRAALAATSALDGRGAATLLVDLVMSELGIALDPGRGRGGRPVALGQAVEALYRMRPVELARFAPLVFEAADAGDDMAAQIVSDATDGLMGTLAAVVVPDIPGPLVFSGSILAQQPAVAERVARSFRGADDSRHVITVSDGLAGAAVLALRHGGASVDETVFARLHNSLAALR